MAHDATDDKKQRLSIEAHAAMLEKLQRENAELRRQLGIAQTYKQLISAQVISRGGDGWWKVIRLDRGSKHGIKVDATVVAVPSYLDDLEFRGWAESNKLHIALVGRVIATTANTSDVLLLTDPNSRVACRLREENSTARGILCGNGVQATSPTLDFLSVVEPLSLDYISKKQTPEPGMLIETSGLGGVFPARIPVGKIIAVEEAPSNLYLSAKIAPFVDFATLEHVMIIASAKAAHAAVGPPERVEPTNEE
ncbi:MAG: rod shape-determining protein MreC [Kiritimatiellae bacterium]|nr:rod shape-determining protein MreC [Kiritimatiellia bacterium]